MILSFRNVMLVVAGSVLLSQGPALAGTPQVQKTENTTPKDSVYDYLLTAKAPKITFTQANVEGRGCYKDLEKLKQYSLVHTPQGGMDANAQKFWLSTWDECSQPALNFPKEAWWDTNLGQWAAFHKERPAMQAIAMAWLIAGAEEGLKTKSPYPVADACSYIDYVRKTGEFKCYPDVVAWANAGNRRYAATTNQRTNGATQNNSAPSSNPNIEQQRQQSEQDAYDRDAQNERQRENDQASQDNENQRQQMQNQQDQDDQTAASNEQRQNEQSNEEEQQREFQNSQNDEQNYHNEQETQAENDRRDQETANENARRQEEADEQAREQAQEEQSREQEQAQQQQEQMQEQQQEQQQEQMQEQQQQQQEQQQEEQQQQQEQQQSQSE